MMGLRKNTAIVMMVVVLIAGLLAGCQPSGSADGTDASSEIVVARVNGEPLTKSSYDNHFALMENAYNSMFGENIWTQEIGGRPVKEIVREELLENMIRERLVSEYVLSTGYEVPENEVQEAYDNFMEVLETDEETKAFYDEKDFGEEFIRSQIESQFIAERFKDMIEEEIREDKATLEQLYETETVLVSASHILVNDDATLALIQEKISAGEDFAELATEYSQDPGSASNGGSLGYFSRGKMVPEFEAVAFSLEIGGISEPVQSQFGTHIIKVDDIQTIRDIEETGASEEEIETYKQTIIESLSQNAYKEKIQELIDNAEVERFPENYKED